MKRSASSAGGSRLCAALWALCVVASAIWLGVFVSRGVPLETSLLAMLPAAEQDPALVELSAQLTGRSSRTLVILVGHDDPEQAVAAAAFVESELRAAGQLSSVRGAFDAEEERAYFDLYFPHRYALLASEMRAELEREALPADLLARVRRLLASPTSALYTGLLERDPLLLYPALVEEWARERVGWSTQDGFLIAREGTTTYALIAAETATDPFATDAQDTALAAVAGLREEISVRFTGAHLLHTGIPRFAAHTRDALQRDFKLIGFGSLLGTALCIVAAFRSLRPFLLSFLPIVVGTIAATLVSFLVFERVHFLTLVFGTSLTGLGVDYALHYFAAHRMAGAEWNADKALRDILPGITLGVVTSVLGFSGLYFTHFPVLQQFALFSSVGLVAAWATVVCWFPLLLASPPSRTGSPWLQRRCAEFLGRWSVWRGRRSMRMVLGALCVAALAVFPLLRFEDDVRALNAAPKTLLAEDQRVRAITGRIDDGRFVLVEGETAEATLQRVEEASRIVHAAIDAGHLESCRDLALFLPSRARQQSDRALLAKRLLLRFPELKSGLDEIGFDAAVVEDLRVALATPPSQPLDVDAWLASPASQSLRPLWLGRTARGFGAAVLLGGVRDGTALEKLLTGHAGIHYVDRVRDLSSLIARYRMDTFRLVLLAYAGVLVALVLRFGVTNGVLVMLPSLLSFGLTLGLLTLCGVRLDLFHLLGLLLVLGLAVDYGVIFAEQGTSEATSLFAIVLSVVTTVAAFGLMITSSAPPLRSLGESVSVGLVLALVFSPLACTSASKRTVRTGLP